MMQTVAFMVLSKKFVGISSASLGIVALTVDPMVFSAAAVIVIGAIAAAAVKIINALSDAKKELIELQLTLGGKIDVVKGHVDGMTTKATEKHVADENTISELRQQLASSEKRAELLAQAKARVDIAAAAPSTSTPVLAQIETNTNATAKNTELRKKKK